MSSQKTPNLNMNKWTDNDYVLVEEINQNFDKIDAKFGDVTSATDFRNNENYIQRGGISPKLIQNIRGTYFITTQKTNKKGYVRFRLREGVISNTESVGGNAELLRCVEVVEVAESFLMVNTPSAKSTPGNFTVYNINYVLPGIGQQSIPCTGILTKAIGNWVEFQVTTPKNVREVEALIYKSSGSSANIDIAVDGVNVLTGQSFKNATAGFERIKIPLPTSGNHTIRFTTNTAEYMSIAGVNVVDLKDFNPLYNYDYVVNINNTNGNQYVTASGSMDYAMLDADTNLWCGSYHGGETRSRLLFLADGIPFILNDGQFRIANIIEIEQDTNIVNKINAYSRQIFQSDGEIEFQVNFVGSINLKTLFTNMATTLDTFTDVLYPVKDNLVNKDRIYLPQGCNYVIQRNPTTNQQAITILNQNKLGSTEPPFIKKLVGSYCKVYSSNVQTDTSFAFNGGSFRVSHIFN